MLRAMSRVLCLQLLLNAYKRVLRCKFVSNRSFKVFVCACTLNSDHSLPRRLIFHTIACQPPNLHKTCSVNHGLRSGCLALHILCRSHADFTKSHATEINTQTKKYSITPSVTNTTRSHHRCNNNHWSRYF